MKLSGIKHNTVFIKGHMGKLTVFVALLLLMNACSSNSFLSQGWDNFTAYYNTFYNAKKVFAQAEEKVEDQLQSKMMNTERPIRIYPTPVNAAEQDFDRVIQKSARILRTHSDSKWADNALLLIGKSYFYQQKYFSAQQKFDELFNASPDPNMRQKAVFWNGRVMLEMQRYREGIQYVTDQLNDPSLEWTEVSRQPANAILSELYTSEGMWTEAVGSLRNAPPHLRDRNAEARAYFLLGQQMDKLEQWHQAYSAFELVPRTAEYEIVYWSDRKRAQMALKVGQPDRAFEILDRMRKDDKNLDRLPSIWYELARSEQQRGNIDQAIAYYQKVLRGSSRQYQAENVTIAKTYFGLGELYQNELKDFSKAAAYYDSAASKRLAQEQRPEWYDAETKAEAFGAYARLSQNIHRMDSLLWLGQLPEAEFDSVLIEIQKQRRKEQRQRIESQQQQANTLVNIGDINEGTTTEQADSEAGFLNINDRAKLATAGQQFRALWGNRPLVDHWRRAEAIQASGVVSGDRRTNLGEIGDAADEELESRITVDISEVPFSQEAQETMRHKKSAANYELGNVFFISLELLDSAAVRYRNVIDQSKDSILVPQALFSISEVKLAQSDSIEAVTMARRLLTNYPRSTFAKRVIHRYEWAELGQDIEEQPSRFDEALEEYRRLKKATEMNYVAQAETLRSLAETHPTAAFAPQAQLDAAELYMKEGKNTEYYQTHIDAWFEINTNWDNRLNRFETLKDSLELVLQDTTVTISDSLKQRYQTVIDSSLTPPEFASYFPYLGAAWDSTRVILDTVSVRYVEKTGKTKKNYPVVSKEFKSSLQHLIKELSLPEALQKQQGQTDSITVYHCDSLGVQVEMADSLNNFAQTINYPESLQGMTLSGEVNVIVTIDETGKVQTVETVDRSSNLGLEEAVIEALQNRAKFKPVKHNGEVVTVQCPYTVPIRLNASR